MAMQKTHPKSKFPSVFINDTEGRDFVRFQEIYVSHCDLIELQSKPWQQFDPKDVSLNLQREHNGVVGEVDLVFADPFYGPQYQPAAHERSTLRKLFDTVTKDYTVFIIFGRPDVLFEYWKPIFDDKLAGSKVEYRIQSSMFHVVRHQMRDKFTNNFSTWHSMCEDAMTVIR